MSFTESSVEAFLQALASDAPAPGGGSASALAGAMGAALCAMVARLTVDRERYRASWESMETLREEADTLCKRFLQLVDLDAHAYDKVIEARRIPKDRAKERNEAIQSALKEAASVPLEILRNLKRLAGLAESALKEGNPNCLSDVGVSAALVRAAARGAAYNVKINLPGIEDRYVASQLDRDTTELMAATERALNSVERAVSDRFALPPSSASARASA